MEHGSFSCTGQRCRLPRAAGASGRSGSPSRTGHWRRHLSMPLEITSAGRKEGKKKKKKKEADLFGAIPGVRSLRPRAALLPQTRRNCRGNGNETLVMKRDENETNVRAASIAASRRRRRQRQGRSAIAIL